MVGAAQGREIKRQGYRSNLPLETLNIFPMRQPSPFNHFKYHHYSEIHPFRIFRFVHSACYALLGLGLGLNILGLGARCGLLHRAANAGCVITIVAVASTKATPNIIAINLLSIAKNHQTLRYILLRTNTS